jgi:hypothetical protein
MSDTLIMLLKHASRESLNSDSKSSGIEEVRVEMSSHVVEALLLNFRPLF